MLTKNNVHYSSSSTDWETPQDLFDTINAVCEFDLDVCATPDKAKCQSFYTPQDDGLAQPWEGSCWMNPPYGRQIGAWMKKAYEESQITDCLVVALVPARTDTKWFQSYAMRGALIFLPGRLRFGNATNAAPFPSALVVFTYDKRRAVYYGQSIAERCKTPYFVSGPKL
jgi:phage N-6-adenine-methyltransferase